MKYLSILFVILLASVANAQITAPDTVCTNTAVNFNASMNEVYHTWVMDSTNINQFNTGNATASGNIASLSTPTYATMNNDGGTWYSFVTNYFNQNITRLDFGANPTSVPTATNLGNFSFPGTQLEGIEILKDPATNNWYGFVVNYSRLMRLDFGTSLANTPTASFYNFAAEFAWAHQIGVAKYGNQWIGFVANRNGLITRLDFGTSITNTPTATNLPKVGSYNNPCNFAIHQQGGNWYMLVSNLIDATITRLNFGTNLQNNSPTGTLLGSVGTLARGVGIFADCNQLIAYVNNENGNVYKLDFNNDITSAPTITTVSSLGTSGTSSFVPFVYNGVQYLNIISFSNSRYYRKSMFTYPTFNSTVFYNPAINYTFTTTGAKNVTLLHNMGSHMGMNAYCKNIYVTNSAAQDLIGDSSFCQNDTLLLDASSSGASTYLWSTGATTSSIKVSTPGKYWLNASGGTLCTANSDTANITITPNPSVTLDSFINKCAGTLIKLENKNTNPGSASFLWSDGTTNATNQFTGTTSKSGKYWLEVNNNGCKAADTATLQINPVPVVYLGPDTIICNSISYKLNAAPQAASSTYLWSNNSTDSSITPTQGGKYSVTVTNQYNCTVADTVDITIVEGPTLDLGPDTTLCYGQEITLYAGLTKVPVTYVWSDSSLGDRLTVKQPGKYTLYAFSDCGLTREDVYIDFYNCELWFPSAFTPNNDGRNDIAKVLGNTSEVSNFELAIFNRWGNRVFHTKDINEAWDGSYEGKVQSTNAFYYYIKYKFRGRDQIMKGSITLIR